ncbi:MAG: penicillin-binding protein 2, partial [Actinobacteria bacterium]|nr:penicillin-binding protein 2 [Actinomycetota bacterium]
IANGGTIWQPTVGQAIVGSDGKVIREIAPTILGKIAASKSTISFLRDALRQVVISGTGAGSFSGFPVPVSGKTGTAEVFGLNTNGTKKDNTSWFASFAPSDKPRYAVVMMVSQGGFGASTSAVGVRKIYQTLFGVDGSKVDLAKAIFPSGPPKIIPKISPTTKVKTS